ncbi:uncharacterized protein PAN0_022c6093 [Moesziomyces antarcticus]|uniref:Uncharacterized protein n=1 Tax=Pseudozyma antarctica TaxID=84753 RepID=A0A081CMG7_PSEA2|nr:uncharacterized protein PAN0_022c6093 [Moesziomyces antarcticus]GAK67863.1 hypothetical protein PAN0_022c6093 [Moesziomyces antarcticus]
MAWIIEAERSNLHSPKANAIPYDALRSVFRTRYVNDGEASLNDGNALDPGDKGKQIVSATQHPQRTSITFRPTPEQSPSFPELWVPYRAKYAPFPFRPVWTKMKVDRFPGYTIFETPLTRGRIRLYIKRVQALDAIRNGFLYPGEAQRLTQPFHPWEHEDLEKVMENLEEYTSLIDAEKMLVNEVEDIIDRVATRTVRSAQFLWAL